MVPYLTVLGILCGVILVGLYLLSTGQNALELIIVQLVSDVGHLKEIISQEKLLEPINSYFSGNELKMLFMGLFLMTLVYGLVLIGDMTCLNSTILSEIIRDSSKITIENISSNSERILNLLGEVVHKSSQEVEKLVLEVTTDQSNDILEHMKNFMAQRDLNSNMPVEGVSRNVLESALINPDAGGRNL